MSTAESLVKDDGSTDHPEQANQGKNSVNATKLDSVIFLLSLLLSVSLLTTVLLWVDLEDMGGGGLSMDAGKQFNWHPVMMVLSFDLMTLAILSFKLPLLQSMDRRIRKSAHGLSWLAAIGCTIFGLVAVFQSHNKTGKGTFIPNLYSLHSWVGIGTFSLFLAQFVAGSLLYGFQLGEDSTRKELMGIHKYFGSLVYFLFGATIMLGTQEKEGFIGCGYRGVTLTEKDTNPITHFFDIPRVCRVGNFVGLQAALMCCFVAFLHRPKQ